MKKPRVLFSLIVIALLTSSLIAAAASAPFLPSSIPPALHFTPVITGLTQPVFITNAADGSNRVFIVQQTGQIKIFKNGSLLPTAFLDVSSVPSFTNAGAEQGLLGLAFDPNYGTNGLFYVTYTTTTTDPVLQFTTTLARYQVSATNADVANAASRKVIIAIPKKFHNHNGGMVAFGPDTYLYMSMGDGGGGGDPDQSAQNIHRLLGKILRLDVHTSPPAGKTYVIPSTNPFFGNSDPTVRQEIWAYGLRNPWRFSFDRLTGDLFIGDVGQNIEEEVDFQAASSAGGNNYGWRVLEGNLCFDPAANCTPPSHYVAPVATYDHGSGDSFGCAVTGGYVYRGSASPALEGVYFYADYCTGKIFGLVHNSNNTWTSQLITSIGTQVSSFGENEQGELFLADYGAGRVVEVSQANIVLAPPFTSEPARDGTIVETSENSGMGGSTDSVGQTLRTGDTVNRRQWRAVLSFDTSSLPDNAVITLARIRLRLAAMTTPDPFATLGTLTVDMSVPKFGPTIALEGVDFQASASRPGAAAFNPVPSGGLYRAAISKPSLGLINRLGRTQFRLRFALDDNNDAVANYAAFFSGNAAIPGDRPTLIIQYYIP